MRRTKADAEETRRQILCAAERVFYEKGVSTATMEDVAHAAGVTRGAIYWHFENKTDLFIALYKSVPLPQKDMVMEEMAAAIGIALALVERMAGDWLDHLSQDTQRQRILAILLRCDYSGDLEAMLNEQQQVDDEHMKALEMAFAAAAANGQLTPCWTPGSAASALRWMMKGLCTEWLLYGRRFDIARQGKEGLRRLFQSFTCDPAGASAPDVRSTELP